VIYCCLGEPFFESVVRCTKTGDDFDYISRLSQRSQPLLLNDQWVMYVGRNFFVIVVRIQ
jgi:hypothetical protein